MIKHYHITTTWKETMRCGDCQNDNNNKQQATSNETSLDRARASATTTTMLVALHILIDGAGVLGVFVCSAASIDEDCLMVAGQ